MKSDLLAVIRIPGQSPAGLAMIEELFDHVPETVFFLKDLAGRCLAVSRIALALYSTQSAFQMHTRR